MSWVFGQQDTLKVGDIVTAKRIPKVNNGWTCQTMTAQDSFITSKLYKLTQFYDQLTYNYYDNSKCIFFRFWDYELSRPSSIYRNLAEKLFYYKPYRRNSQINFAMASGLYEEMLDIIGYNCEYFDKVTEYEFNTPRSSFNRVIYFIFGRHKNFLESELQKIDTDLKKEALECYLKNLEIILNSLELTESKKSR